MSPLARGRALALVLGRLVAALRRRRGWQGALGLVVAGLILLACSRADPPRRTRVTAKAPPPTPRAPAPKRQLAAGEQALTHVTVIDVVSGRKLPDQAVVVSNDTVVAVLPASSLVQGPQGAGGAGTVVDARGKFLIPGLWDMHAHFNDASSNLLFMANGVTGVRIMNGHMHARAGRRTDVALRQAYDTKREIGPRMVIGSTIVDGPNPVWPGTIAVANAAEGRRVVAEQRRLGAEFIKVYSLLPRDAFLAIADECKRRWLPFAGHVPESVTAAEASDAGQKSIEHLGDLTLSCSSREADIRRRLRADGRTGPERFDANAVRERRHLAEEAIATYDQHHAAALFAKFIANGTWQVPTLVNAHAQSTLDELGRTRDARWDYLSAATKRRWNPKTDFRSKNRTPEDYAAMRRHFPNRLAMVGAMNRAGVGILAGSDEENPGVFPGFSLHDELGFLVKAGLTPVEALRAATLSPARFLGKSVKMGTIAPGKVADLVVLDADPTVDIANTKKIFAVMSRGTLYNRAALDRMLEQIRRAAARAR